MNILIVGYGRMGKEIEQQALQHNHSIVHTVDPYASDATCTHLNAINFEKETIDIAIEFSTASSIVENAHIYTQNTIPAIIGTTGWSQDMSHIQSIVQQSSIAYLYGSNFSIGAHIFMKTSEILAQFLNNVQEYDITIQETHHAQKIDRPSGTALSTAKKILDTLDRKTAITIDIPNGTPIDPSQLAIVSQRVGREPGYHEVIADSSFDTLTLSHRARTRSGFALGAVRAAEWLYTKKLSGLIPVEQFIEDILRVSLT